MTPHLNVGIYLTQQRYKKNLTRREISDLLFCSEQFYGRIENGAVGLPMKHAKILLKNGIINKSGLKFAMLEDYREELEVEL